MAQILQEIQGKFYPLTRLVGKKLREAKLTAAEWRIWSYLSEIDPFGDRYEGVETLQIMSECGVSKATFYRAIAKFQEFEIFDFQAIGFTFINKFGISQIKRVVQNCEKSLKNEKPVAKMRPDSQNCFISLKNETEISEMRQNSQICENQPAKPSLHNDSGSPQTLHTNPNIKDSTDSESARESVKISEGWKPEILKELKALRINPADVSWVFKKFSEIRIEEAIAYIKQQSWSNKPAGLFVKACKEGLKPEVIEKTKPLFPEPTDEDMEKLEQFKNLALIHDHYLSSDGIYKAVCKRPSGASYFIPWWEAIDTYSGYLISDESF